MSTEQLATEIIRVLDVKARQGARRPEETWTGFENGEGVEVGQDIERLIRKAKAVVKKQSALAKQLRTGVDVRTDFTQNHA